MFQADVSGLVSQLQDLQRKNAELEEENNKLTSKVTLHSILCVCVCVIVLFIMYS